MTVKITPLKEREKPSPEERYTESEERGIVPRNHQGRPMIWLPDGSKRVPYSRPSGLGEALDDKENLFPWTRGRAVIGAMRDPELIGRLREAEQDGIDWDGEKGKDLAKAVGNEAFVKGGGEDRADRGTMWHQILEEIDWGRDPGFIPEELQPFVDAYQDMMTRAREVYNLDILATEVFGVFDDGRVAGTTDAIIEMDHPFVSGVRTVAIGDKKTSRSLGFSMGKFAIQLWAYSQMVGYDPRLALLGEDQHGLGVGRVPFGGVEGPIADDFGIIFWSPSGRAHSEVVPIQIAHGAQGFELVNQVKEWRNMWKRKALAPRPLIVADHE